MEKAKKYQIIIAGRGGQGILLAGHILGKTLVKKGYYVVHSETYSAETRGGDSRSDLIVTIGEEPDLIRIRRADIAIFMFDEQMERYAKWVKDDATVILDSTYIDKPTKNWSKIISIPFSKLAEEKVGNRRVANMVMLGSLSVITGLFEVDLLKEVVAESVRPEWKDVNLKAIDVGFEAAKEMKLG